MKETKQSLKEGEARKTFFNLSIYLCIYLYIYKREGHSLNKGNFLKNFLFLECIV